jgi:hypothetical protein
MSENQSKQDESAAYHEAGHITAAVLQAMPLRETGVHVDLYGHGCADYFQKVPEDVDTTELDHRERKLTMIAIFAAHMTQLKFYPDCETDGWVNDLACGTNSLQFGLTYRRHFSWQYQRRRDRYVSKQFAAARLADRGRRYSPSGSPPNAVRRAASGAWLPGSVVPRICDQNLLRGNQMGTCRHRIGGIGSRR